jgi:hypothetical protein
MKLNAISQDFPFKVNQCNISPIKTKENRPSLKIYTEIKNGFNNESPDFFRLDSMQENKLTYKNPYLEEVIPEDRSAFYKNMQKAKDQITIIDMIKSSRNFSQDPKVLKQFIAGVDDRDVIAKRNRVKLLREKAYEAEEKKPKYQILANKEDNAYMKALIKLNYDYSPKHNFLIKNSLNLSNSESLINPNTSLKLPFDYKKSSYIRNHNDYNIKENIKENEDKFFYFNKKPVKCYNCITDEKVDVQPGVYKAKRWESFYEK